MNDFTKSLVKTTVINGVGGFAAVVGMLGGLAAVGWFIDRSDKKDEDLNDPNPG